MFSHRLPLIVCALTLFWFLALPGCSSDSDPGILFSGDIEQADTSVDGDTTDAEAELPVEDGDTQEGEQAADGDSTDGDSVVDGDLPIDGDTADGDASDGDLIWIDGDFWPDGDDVDGDDTDGDEELQRPRRGWVEELPAESASCEDACKTMADCGHFEGRHSAIDDEADCLQRCQNADSLPFGGPTYSDDYFKRCASQTDCNDNQYCSDWLADPRVDYSCEVVCLCMEGYMNETGIRTDFSMLNDTAYTPQGLTPATDVQVFDNRSSLDIEAALDAFDVPARLYAKGHFVQIRATQLADPQGILALAQNMEPLPTFRDANGRILAATDRLIVTPKTGRHTLQASSFAALGLQKAKQLSWSPSGMWIAQADSPREALRIAAQLNQRNDITAEIDYVRFYKRHYIPNDPLFDYQWHLRNTGMTQQVAHNDARVWEAWDLEKGEQSVVLGINDDGCDLNHPDLVGNMEPALDFPDDWEAQALAGSFGWHGSSVAGVTAAKGDNSIGVSGVCPNCRLRCSNAFEYPSEDDPIGSSDSITASKFVLQADAGTAAVNNSWGYDMGDPLVWGDAPALIPLAGVIRDAFAYAESDGRDGKGMVILFSAGNENTDLAGNEMLNVDTIVTVGATDDQGLKSYYSSFGATVDITAPSNGGITGIVTTAARGSGDNGQDDYTFSFGGTSSSCPFTTGVVGLILSANPDLTAAQVRDILKKSARKIDPAHGKWDENGHSKYYGYGMVDAYVAVSMALDAQSCTEREDCLSPTDRCTSIGRDGACERAACDECTDNSQCASGACQALPELQKQLCVESMTEQGACPAEHYEVNGYCLPQRGACGSCDSTEDEVCNGRDDDCNGVVDDGGVCGDYEQLCHDDRDCPSGTICLALQCYPTCTNDADCASDQYEMDCLYPSGRFGGELPSSQVCMRVGFGMECDAMCGLMLSDNDDQNMLDIQACIEDQVINNQVNCMGLFQQCMSLLGGRSE